MKRRTEVVLIPASLSRRRRFSEETETTLLFQKGSFKQRLKDDLSGGSAKQTGVTKKPGVCTSLSRDLRGGSELEAAAAPD